MSKTYRLFALSLLCAVGSAVLHAQSDNPQNIFEGEGTADAPYLISNVDDLLLLQRKVADEAEFSKGKYFRMTSDIRLNDNVLNDDGALAGDTARLSRWSPIGQGETLRPYYAFQGNFDGNGHTVYGLFINDSTRSGCGLFGFIHKGGLVHHLSIADSYILGSGAVGSIAGQCHEGTVAHCTSSATVTAVGATYQVGGIVGSLSGGEGHLLRCTNDGHVSGHAIANEYGEKYNCTTGGICGNLGSAIVDSCQNNGVVISRDWGDVGGVVGSVSGGAQVRWSVHRGYVSSMVKADIGGIVGSNWQTVTGCRNEGQVVATAKGSSVGGIVGVSSWNSRIYDSENLTDLICSVDSVSVGGIVGNLKGHRDGTYYVPKVYDCVNHARIETTHPDSQAGGISGRAYCGEIHDCTNHGVVASESEAGGITPTAEYHAAISGCHNAGAVTGRSNTGGIVGYTNEAVDDCWNSGEVSNKGADSNAGGIVGHTSGSVCGCVNTGSVHDAYRAGGIAGNNSYSSVVSECYNAGGISSETTGASIAGISAGNGSVRNCYNVGTVTSKADDSTVSGVAVTTWLGNGQWGEVNNCYNMGDICVAASKVKAGSIVGETANVGRISNCYYLAGAIRGNSFIASDSYHQNLTAVAEDDFRSLADRLNKREWEFDPAPFVQGYYRPVLQCTRNLLEKHYFEVATQSGDSTLIDLGKPADNTIFTTTDTGIVLEAYNVLHDGAVRRAMLIDASDFTYTTPFTARQLFYTRLLNNSYGTSCLPFEVLSEDMPEGCQLFKTVQLQDNATVLADEVQCIEAGKPFVFSMPEGTTIWNVEKQQVTLTPEPFAGESLMRGVFSLHTDWDDNCYVPGEESFTFRKAKSSDMLLPFRAYVQTSGSNAELLSLTLSPTTTVRSVMPTAAFSIVGRNVVLGNTSGLPVRVFTIKGQLVYENYDCSSHPIIIHIEKQGVYNVSVGPETWKIHIR